MFISFLKNGVKDNMNKRGNLIIILCLLICVILSLQSATAAANDLNTTNVTNNNVLSLPTSDNNVLGAGEGSFTDLNKTINGNSSQSVINLDKNYKYNPATDSAFKDIGIIITRNLTINGNDYTIDAANYAGIFVVRASVTINNVVFVNGNYSSHGGAIDFESFSGSSINKCTFINNTAAGDGGAIFWRAGAHDGVIYDSIFINNTAGLNGGAVAWYMSAERGAIFNSVFINNTAYRSAGAVLWFGHDGKIKNSNFTGNRALGLREGPDAYGNNTTGGDGGAVLWVGADGIADNCIFIGNNASTRGGAIFLEGGTNIECDNTTVKNSKFISNHAGTNGGAVDWHDGAHDGTILDSIFENNIADANGGAVYWRGHHGDITRSNFTSNTAMGLTYGTYGNNGDGGALFWAGVNGTVDTCRFIGNQAILNSTSTTSSGRGGAAYLEPGYHGYCENTSFHNCYFEDNVAGTNGGAVAWDEGASNGTVDTCIFNNNTAKRNGGAIFWNGHNGTIKNSKFNNNRATGENHQYNMTVNMGDQIVVGEHGTLILGNIIVIQNSSLPRTTPYIK